MATKASLRQTKYDNSHCRTYGLKLNLGTDADIIKKLASVPSMQGYIKQLIRDDIARTHDAEGIADFVEHVQDILDEHIARTGKGM